MCFITFQGCSLSAFVFQVDAVPLNSVNISYDIGAALNTKRMMWIQMVLFYQTLTKPQYAVLKIAG